MLPKCRGQILEVVTRALDTDIQQQPVLERRNLGRMLTEATLLHEVQDGGEGPAVRHDDLIADDLA